ncbi:MAG TPA: A/G-specific adenine glycosylase [Chloroflexota bacterium]|nr:A/G-specific adenine glycosylase [Chloroflexota bacterium]
MSEPSQALGGARKRQASVPPAPPTVERHRLAAVHDALLSWYARVGRDLPWRRTRDPYAILVSEIMLQQTQVDRVIPKYFQFLEAFPNLEALAAAPLADVIRVWAGLGYNRRAVRLHAIAREAVERLGGSLPETAEELRELEGLGAYTANAVACFSGEAQVGVVDTNVRRVLGRVFAEEIGLDPPAGPVLQRFAEAVLPEGRAYAWNQALMDLGATVCTSRSPNHDACPLALHCTGRSLLSRAEPVRRAAEPGVAYRVAQPFEQTTRFFRGRIVAACRDLEPGETLGLDDLGRALRSDYSSEHATWVAGLVEGLRRDGLVAVDESVGGPRVSLP